MVLERRRHLRHKVHSPAYASIGAGVGGVVLDATESGAAVESVARPAPQSFIDLRLDLLETHSSAVTPARVAWCDDGRVGLEFLNLTGESRRQLQQWLLLNTLLATESASQLALKRGAIAGSSAAPRQPVAPDSALQALAEQALADTGAHGAAIALAEGTKIVCRASAGEIAPPPGTQLDAQRGISGACVRTRDALRCDDPEADANVDRESCRALGINSVVAVPIMAEQGNVLGVIEVFSRQTYAFQREHCSALQDLAKNIALSVPAKAAEPSPAIPAAAQPPIEAVQAPAAVEPLSAATTATAVAPASAVATANPVVPDKAEKPAASVGRGQGIVILGLATALVILGLWFVLSRNTGEMKQVDAAEPNASRTQPVEQPGTSAAAASSGLGTASASGITDSLRELRQRAQAGDSESQFELGAKYATGEEIPQDYPEAVKWFTRAAEGGQVLAAATLGAYYWAGRGVPRDDVSAYMWSSIARLEGDEASRYRIAILRARMTAQQIMEGEQRTARWREAHFRAFSTATALTPQ